MSSESLRPGGASSKKRLTVAKIVAVAIVVAIVAGGLFVRTMESRHLREWTDEQAIQSVSVIQPKPITHGSNLELPGRLDAFNRAPIFSRVSGYVKAWHVDIGASVKSGQLLAEIDTPELDQQLQQARANLRTAQANANLAGVTAKRWQALEGTDSVSQQDIDQRTGELAAKQADVAAAQADVNRLIAMKGFTRIVAPFDGTVTSRDIDVGNLINSGKGGPGQELFTIADVKQLRVYVQVPQNFAPDVRRDTKVTLKVPAFPTQTFDAHVVASAGAVNPGSGTTLIQLMVDNADGKLMPGGFATIDLSMPARPDTLSVPASALVFDSRGLTIATVGDGDRVAYRKVTISRDLGKTVEIQSGLEHGDRVIDTPPDGLADGDKVKIARDTKKGSGNG
jgi:RND family efflux transporter MFP subunit